MRTRTSYDTSLKHLYRKGLEEAVPEEMRQHIPRSTIHRWRHEKDNKYVGHELNDLAKTEIELLKEFIRSKNARRIFYAYVRVGRFMQSLTSEKYFKDKIRKNKEDFIDVVERARKSLPLDHILKCFSLSKTTYNLWVLGLFSGCSRSKLDWCLRRQPHQLDQREVEIMNKLLTDPSKTHWPITSIAHYARRNDLMHASISTWYKYAKLLNINRAKPKFRKIKGKPGIKATVPNKIWHADVSYFKIGLTNYYIYFVVDNYSKMILSHKVSKTLSGQVRLDTIKNAFKRVHDPEQDLMLMVDGGAENNNKKVDDFVDEHPNLTKIRALHDIKFGNGQVEAHNRILKHNWLYHKNIESFDQLVNEVDDFVIDFNEVRPNGVLEGLTPKEAHLGIPAFVHEHKELMKEARCKRYQHNKCNTCEKCELPTILKNVDQIRF